MWQERQGQRIHGDGLVTMIHRTDRRRSTVDLYCRDGQLSAVSAAFRRSRVQATLKWTLLRQIPKRACPTFYQETSLNVTVSEISFANISLAKLLKPGRVHIQIW